MSDDFELKIPTDHWLPDIHRHFLRDLSLDSFPRIVKNLVEKQRFRRSIAGHLKEIQIPEVVLIRRK